MRRLALLAIFLLAASVADGQTPAPAPDPDPAQLAAVTVLSGCVAAAEAAGRPIEACEGEVSRPCLSDPNNFTTAAMMSCFAREATAWDALLNSDYQRLLARRSTETAALLRDAQRAWIAFRDADCLFVQTSREGTIGRINGAACVNTHTLRRVADLRLMLADDAG